MDEKITEPVRHSFVRRPMDALADVNQNRFGQTVVGSGAAMKNLMPEDKIVTRFGEDGGLIAQASILDSPAMQDWMTRTGLAIDSPNGHHVVDLDAEPPMPIMTHDEILHPTKLGAILEELTAVIEDPERVRKPVNAVSASCHACSAVLPQGAKFCVECGVKQRSRFCTECSFKFTSSEKFCPDCGKAREL